MARKTKAPEERRLEIVETSERLFLEVGYTKCSVDMIIKEIGVAKGTFYYYFKSKEEILGAIVDRNLDQIVAQAGELANEPTLTAMEKMAMLLGNTHIGDENTREIAEMMHLPENREMHELTNIQTVLRLSPVIAKIVEQGIREKVFVVKYPLETVQFLLTGAQFLLDGGLFEFSPQETQVRREVTQRTIEISFGAPTGSFDFMNPDLKGKENNE